MAGAGVTAVLGGAGFLGSHLTEALLAGGRRVRVFDRPNADLRNLAGATGDWDFLGGDFLNQEDQRAALRGADTVFHLVSTTIPASSNRNPVYDVETNLVASVRMLDLAVEAGVSRVVFVSSGGTVYGPPQALPVAEDHPTDPRVSYGVVKLAVEKYLRVYRELHGLSYRILRLANPYGPRQDPAGAQGAASVFLGRVHRGLPVEIWGDGSVVRDYLYVADAVAGVLAAAGTAGPAGLYNIGSGKGVSLRRLVELIGEVSGRPVRVAHLDPRPFDVPENVLDISRARRELGWAPRIPLREGLARTWAWLEAGGAGEPRPE